jgi:hypothetical protein
MTIDDGEWQAKLCPNPLHTNDPSTLPQLAMTAGKGLYLPPTSEPKTVGGFITLATRIHLSQTLLNVMAVNCSGPHLNMINLPCD